jgi:two-component system response regulator AtoC
VLPIKLLPLRAHMDDVPALVSFYVDAFNREFKKNVRGASAASMRALTSYGWPGNVREIRNAVERAMLLAEGDYLEPADFPIATAAAGGLHRFELPPSGVDLEAVERSLVTQALERTGWNQSRAAMLLGINRDQIRYRVEKFGLTHKAATGQS